jgi:hypothetical protein
MNIKNRKLKRLLWEIRRHAIIIAVYAVMFFLAVWAICFVLALPELIGMLIFG